jgi:hypothetical protein
MFIPVFFIRSDNRFFFDGCVFSDHLQDILIYTEPGDPQAAPYYYF